MISKTNLPSERYPKFHRLRNKSDFTSFYEKSRFRVLGTVKVYFCKNTSSRPRLGLAISSKYFNAVQRNSLKRLIREYFRKNHQNFVGLDWVVTVRFSKNEQKDWKTFLSKVRYDLSQLILNLNAG